MPLNLASTGGGSVTLQADSTASAFTQTIPAVSGTNGPIVSGTAVASTSGTTIDFTGIPSWAKRVTVIFSGVSSSGTSGLLLQIGSGSFTTSGYVSTGFASSNGVSPAVSSSTAGFLMFNDNAGDVRSGTLTVTNITGTTYVQNHTMSSVAARNIAFMGAGTLALGSSLDRVRVTTVNGTDTFDAGTINILYE